MASPLPLRVSRSSASAHQTFQEQDSVAYARLTPPPTHSNSFSFSQHEFDDHAPFSFPNRPNAEPFPLQSRAIRLLNLPDALLDLSSLPESSLSSPSNKSKTSREKRGTSSRADSSPLNLSQLLALLPPRRRRLHRTLSDSSYPEEQKPTDHSDAKGGVIAGPHSKRERRFPKGDEASHLRGEGRENYERKRDERLTHYQDVDAFQLHVENVMWI